MAETGEVRLAEDLARFGDDLRLFLVVTRLRIHLGVVAEEIERIGMRQHLLLILAPFERRRGWTRRSSSIAAAPRARGGLVGRDDQALDAVQLVDRPRAA